MALHSSLTGSDLHESKGVATASAGTVAIADGSGSTTFAKISTGNIDATFKNMNNIILSGAVPDLSTNGSHYLVPVPFNCTVTNILIILNNAITVADGILVLANPGVGTIASVTVPYTSSTTGTAVTATLSSNNNITAGNYISVTASTGSTGTCIAYFVITGTMT